MGHIPAGPRWKFDQSVTDVFDDMLRRSIPQYDVMRQAVYDLGSSLVQPQTSIVDLGCSRGDALAPFVNAFGSQNTYIGIDVSPPMLEVAKKRFDRYINDGIVQIQEQDLIKQYPQSNASLTLCVLTLQFTPLEFRQAILRKTFLNTLPGGGLILVEKVLGGSGKIDSQFVHLYHNLKRRNGYSTEEIESKRLALQDVLVPLTAAENENMLRIAGFQSIDCFWRWMNFCAYIAIKN